MQKQHITSRLLNWWEKVQPGEDFPKQKSHIIWTAAPRSLQRVPDSFNSFINDKKDIFNNYSSVSESMKRENDKLQKALKEAKKESKKAKQDLENVRTEIIKL